MVVAMEREGRGRWTAHWLSPVQTFVAVPSYLARLFERRRLSREVRNGLSAKIFVVRVGDLSMVGEELYRHPLIRTNAKSHE